MLIHGNTPGCPLDVEERVGRIVVKLVALLTLLSLLVLLIGSLTE